MEPYVVGLAKTPGGSGAMGAEPKPKELVTEKKLTIIKTEKLFIYVTIDY